MTTKESTEEINKTLVDFLARFREYADSVKGGKPRDELRNELQRDEPRVTNYLNQILGNGTYYMPRPFMTPLAVSQTYLLVTALAGGNNEIMHNFYNFRDSVIGVLNKALGTLEAGLWPRAHPLPQLVIKDAELAGRCEDLLLSRDNYDRVVREATTVLENRIRQSIPHELLARLIPNAADQMGDRLINRLFSPDSLVLRTSEDRQKCIALHRMLLAVVSYLRNPYHHQLDADTELSWAWSTVGLVDRLLAEVETCLVVEP